MVQFIERVAGHYEVEEVEFGAVYKWNPPYVTLRCDCGEKLTLSTLTTLCEECGADRTASLGELLTTQRVQRDKTIHPWRYSQNREDGGMPF